MEARKDKLDIIGYTFDLKEMVVIKAAFGNSIVRAFIQTKRTNYVTEHVLTPLLDYQERGPDIKLNMSLNEAYLKGALDFAAELLDSVTLPGES